MAQRLPEVDVVLVGMGRTGALLAKELTDAGPKWVGLERGFPRQTVPDLQSPTMHDELRYAVRHGLMLDPARSVASCASCHGARGEGAAPGVPALAGQYAAYTELQLRLWKQGVRRNDPFGVMAQVAAGMTEQEIAAVAAYYASLRPAAGALQAGR